MSDQIRRDPRINWITKPVHKKREVRGLTSIGKQVGRIIMMSAKRVLFLIQLVQNRGIIKGQRYNNTPRVATWKRHNTLSLRRYR